MARGAAEEAVGYNRHAALVLAARGALWARDSDSLHRLLETMRGDPSSGRATTAGQRTLEAGAAALRGEANAQDLYRHAIAAWRELDLPLPHLLALIERNRFLRPSAQAKKEILRLMDQLQARGLAAISGPATA